MLVLHVIQGPDRGKRFVLPENEPQLIGRSSEALPITDNTVSRRHAELTPDNGTWWLRDLESSNGIYVNGNLIVGRHRLEPGDQIRCGSTLLMFAKAPEDDRPSSVHLMDGEAFDVTVERTAAASDDSMILAAPDPVKAAMDHLRVIYELTALTTAVVDPTELLERVMDLVFEEFKPDRGFVLLQEGPDAPSTPAVVRYREKPKTVDEGRIPVSRTIIDHTLRRREGTLSTNAMNDSRFRSGDSVRDYGIRSAICVPILSSDRIFGVIHIDSSLMNFTFTDSQLRLLNAIGQHTGLALLSVELVRERMQTERLAVMGQTVASLSHSIKNILQGLRGGADAVELALNREDLEMARQGWPILVRNLGRIFTLTLNMLAYSKPTNLEIELHSLNTLVAEVIELLQPQTEQRSAGIISDLADDLPPIPMDVNAMHQLLMNLVTNAIEAVPSRKGVITIATAYDAASQQAILTVTDNGPGIPEGQHETIFEAFHSSKGQRGTGLGLAVSRKITDEHGGTLTVDSTPGSGASFRLTIPVDREMDASETRLPRPLAGSGF